MSDRPRSPNTTIGRVRNHHGLWAVLLAPVALLSAPLWGALLAFTPLVVTGPGLWLAYAFSISGFIAAVGVVLSIASVAESRRVSPSDTHRRASSARTLGIVGLLFNLLVILGLIALWFWLTEYLATAS